MATIELGSVRRRTGSGTLMVLGALSVIAGCARFDRPPERRAAPAMSESTRAHARLEELLLHGRVPSHFSVVDGAVNWQVAEAVRAHVSLPLSADGPIAVRDLRSGLAIKVWLAGSEPAPVEVADGAALYVKGLESHDLVLVPRAWGIEDFVVLEQPLDPERLTYRVDVSRVAGLRLVGRSLEFVDSAGAPRLRMAPPSIVDAAQTVHQPDVHVAGCNFDVKPNPPWGREPTPPGSPICEVEIDWRAEGVAYPALLDPRWTTTDSLALARTWAQGARLADGRVLVAGGNAPSPTPTAELYDEGTKTWAGTGNMTVGRRFFTLVSLPNGDALAAGGSDGSNGLSSAELFSGGTFTAVGSMSSARQLHAAVLLADGRVLVSGGLSSSTLSSAELYDPVNRTFGGAQPMIASRRQHTLTLLSSGGVLAASGTSGTTYRGGEVYDPAGNQWTSTQAMGVPRQDHAAVRLTDGRVLVVGGYNGSLLSSAEIYDPASNGWALTSSMNQPHDVGIAVTLDNGGVLVTGGCATTSCGSGTAYAELFDPATANWTPTTPMTEPRVTHIAQKLSAGSVLVATGLGSGALSSAELFTLSSAGETCSVNVECASGSCVGTACGTGVGGTGGIAGSSATGGSGGVSGTVGTGGIGAAAGTSAAGGAGGAATGGTNASGGSTSVGGSAADGGSNGGSAGTAGVDAAAGAAAASGTRGRTSAEPEPQSFYGCTLARSPSSSWIGLLLSMALGALGRRKPRSWRDVAISRSGRSLSI